MMEVRADPERCNGSGNCVMIAPAVFDQSEDDGTVVVGDPAPPPALHRDVRRAAELCPMQAITVTDGPGAAPGTPSDPRSAS